eukprot:CAMPEP_0203819494 /NCGR_PEP_ID=MMETSP0115-20131106/36129_1 /ASSEMBLY_ACC=CAM_ASM_000227 /TAXON_ID=33651 /ORGANISM="Bicosoecid sp, Strain ms1" /LENGTH=1020 /DNA_ID=CAMNT_0050728479 /DNA_START=294 /DNA_END=3352 /DNA_ORIENTATION=-
MADTFDRDVHHASTDGAAAGEWHGRSERPPHDADDGATVSPALGRQSARRDAGAGGHGVGTTIGSPAYDKETATVELVDGGRVAAPVIYGAVPVAVDACGVAGGAGGAAAGLRRRRKPRSPAAPGRPGAVGTDNTVRQNRDLLEETLRRMVAELRDREEEDAERARKREQYSNEAIAGMSVLFVAATIVAACPNAALDLAWGQIVPLKDLFTWIADPVMLVCTRFPLVVLGCIALIVVGFCVFHSYREALAESFKSWLFNKDREGLAAGLTKHFIFQDAHAGAFVGVTYLVTLGVFETFVKWDTPSGPMLALVFLAQGALAYRGHKLGMMDDDKAFWRWGRHLVFWYANGAYRVHGAFATLDAGAPRDFVAGQVVLVSHALPVVLLGMFTTVPSMALAQYVSERVAARRLSEPLCWIIKCIGMCLVEGVFVLWGLRQANGMAETIVARMPDYHVSWEASATYTVLGLALPTLAMVYLAVDAINIAYRATGLARIRWRQVSGFECSCPDGTFDWIDDIMMQLGLSESTPSRRHDGEDDSADDDDDNEGEGDDDASDSDRDDDDDDEDGEGSEWVKRIVAIAKNADMVFDGIDAISSLWDDSQDDDAVALRGGVALQNRLSLQTRADKGAEVPRLRAELQRIPHWADLSWKQRLFPCMRPLPVTWATLQHAGSTIDEGATVATLGLHGRLYESGRKALVATATIGLRGMLSSKSEDAAARSAAKVRAPGLRVVAYISRQGAPNLFAHAHGARGNPSKPGLLRRAMQALDRVVRPFLPDIPIVLFEAVDGEIRVLGQVAGNGDDTQALKKLLDDLGRVADEHLKGRLGKGGDEVEDGTNVSARLRRSMKIFKKHQRDLSRHVTDISGKGRAGRLSGFGIAKSVWRSMRTIIAMLQAFGKCAGDKAASDETVTRMSHLVLDCLAAYSMIVINTVVERMLTGDAGGAAAAGSSDPAQRGAGRGGRNRRSAPPNVIISLAPLVAVLFLRKYAANTAIRIMNRSKERARRRDGAGAAAAAAATAAGG